LGAEFVRLEAGGAVDFRTEAALAAFIPSVVFLGIVYTRDRYEREPKLLIARLYVMSVLACAVAIVLESALRIDLTGSVVTVVISAIGVGLIEEGAIFGVVVLATRRSRQLNEPVDGMVYASTVALGFAAIETFLYILRAFDIGVAYHLTPAHAASIALTQVAPERAILGNLGHMAWSGIIGYAYARRRLKLGGRFQLLCAYLAAASLHAVYDGTLSLNAPTLAYTSLAFSLVVYVHLFRHSLAASPFRRQQLRTTPLPPPLRHPSTATVADARAGMPTHPRAPSPPPMFVPDAVIPAGGLPIWAYPDASSRLIGRLEPGTGVQTLDRLGAWAHVLSPLGWSGWIDGRGLVPPPIAPPI
jgi:RsiW-degrading membrane proteinase PrsW (M82 family)